MQQNFLGFLIQALSLSLPVGQAGKGEDKKRREK
jgi:hypothetical protein